MSIKLIAVDMDGTFLSDAKTYNRPRFLAQYQRMREQNIRFVVASGNQYYQLISFFPEIAHQIATVQSVTGDAVSAIRDITVTVDELGSISRSPGVQRIGKDLEAHFRYQQIAAENGLPGARPRLWRARVEV